MHVVKSKQVLHCLAEVISAALYLHGYASNFICDAVNVAPFGAVIPWSCLKGFLGRLCEVKGSVWNALRSRSARDQCLR